MSNIKESSIGRMNQHLTEDKNFAIISPCKNGDSKEEHKKNLAKLKNEVYNKYGLGFIELISKWVDEEGNVFDEFALFVPNMSKKVAMKLGEEYSQCSVIICEDGKCEEICTTPFDTYNVGDTVRTFNLSSDTPMNITLAKSILDKGNMGAVSVTKKGNVPFHLSEVLEVIPAKASMFGKEERYNRIYCEEFSILPIGKNTVAQKVVKEELKEKYNLDLSNLDSTNGIVYGLSKKRAIKICEKYSVPYTIHCDGYKASVICASPFDGFAEGDTLSSFNVPSDGSKNITESVIAHCSKFSRLVEGLEESRRYRKVQKSLYGDPNGKIKTFAIISPENPEGALGDKKDPNFKENYLDYLGDKDKGQFDGKTREELATGIRREGDRIFRIGRLPHVKLQGEYDGREKSYMIFNLTPSDAFKIAHAYGQESFFFGRVFEDHSDIAYYKTTNRCKSYRLIEVSQTVSDESEADNYFSKFGSKFKINMAEFDDDVPEVKNASAFDASLSEGLSYMMKAEARKLMTKDTPENFREEYSVFNHVTPYERKEFPKIFIRR